ARAIRRSPAGPNRRAPLLQAIARLPLRASSLLRRGLLCALPRACRGALLRSAFLGDALFGCGFLRRRFACGLARRGCGYGLLTGGFLCRGLAAGLCRGPARGSAVAPARAGRLLSLPLTERRFPPAWLWFGFGVGTAV